MIERINSELFQVKTPYSKKDAESGLLKCGAVIDSRNNSDDHGVAIWAMNLNILRRRAPFAYLFANELASVEEFRNEDFGCEAWYQQSLPAMLLLHGVWITNPLWDSPAQTVIVDISYRDISPFVFAMNEEVYALLCIPNCMSLECINSIIQQAPSNKEAVLMLLKEGGFIVYIPDGVYMSVLTLDPNICAYFEPYNDNNIND
ncbi:MAG: hypothetical protein WCJ56_01230 [bacterium]